MGSRIMHLIIANQIAEKINIQDKHAFFIGGVAPDAVYPKGKSHFFVGHERDYTTTVEFEKFLNKYPKTDYVLGYYTHLIADYVWVKGFYQGWLKNRIDADHSLLARYHEDFRLLNAKLLYHYQLDSSILDNLNFNNVQDLDEVKGEDVQAFFPYVKEDMNYPKEHLEEELQVFTLLQIVGYVETCVERGLLKLRALGVE
ncbi:zinc dependent phospholipase C family protein [Paucisalibacillus globulus]|uniref:zinc dependent phospholipase C family protein n=1 Tax=Paucisalibacillus globulus TaxID=351095 RepID=UPI0003F8473C|nr:zinc dependent phospholipase C family protein [Paucisalibacillus globulus]